MSCPEGRMEVSYFGMMLPFYCKYKKKGKCPGEDKCQYMTRKK